MFGKRFWKPTNEPSGTPRDAGKPSEKSFLDRVSTEAETADKVRRNIVQAEEALEAIKKDVADVPKVDEPTPLPRIEGVERYADQLKKNQE